MGFARLTNVPRLPLVPDPLRRVRVPKDLESITALGEEEEPVDVGMTSQGVERIWNAAANLYRGGAHPAVQLCVRRHGKVVLDRAIGHARGNGPQDRRGTPKVAATPDTPFVVYSASKAITATVVHRLIERGLIGLHTPIAEYIPEYAIHGKEGITVGHVLAHRAGVPNLPREVLDLEGLGDAEHILRVMCDARPSSKPGQRLAYHAISGGFILAEVVQRVTGAGIREVLAKEILDPLGFRWTNYGVRPEDVPEVGLSYVTGPPVTPPISTLLTRALGLNIADVVERSNDPRFLTGVVPSANIVTTANELSRFFEVLRRGGEYDGVRVLQPETIELALTEQSHLEVDFTLGFPTRFGYGYMLGSKLISLFGPDTVQAFGHLGFVNILGWADPERAISCALITSGKPIVYPGLRHFLGIGRRIGKEAPKV